MPSRRLALISVTDKTGVVELGRGLVGNGFELLSTGGTAKALRAASVPVTEVADFTGFPECLGGRVKTLQAKLLGGILARTHLPSDRADLERLEIPPVEVVVVNLYRFAHAAARFRSELGASGVGRSLADPAVEQVVEEIDIGGPTLVRAAAKNATRVAIVVDPADYPRVVAATRDGGTTSLDLRAELAAKAFRSIAEYDRDVALFFDRYVAPATAPKATLPAESVTLLQGDLPCMLEPLLHDGVTGGLDAKKLRYGENPHQRAFLLRGREPGEADVLHARVLTENKELSYNNLLDADSALELVKEFDAPAAVVVKHNNPCGCAVGESAGEAFARAYDGDPLSAFGGILALNRPIDAALARQIATADHFFEVIVAPEVPDDALAILKSGAAWGKSVRVLACGDTKARAADAPKFAVRSLVGGVLVQERDLEPKFELVAKTKRKPTADEERDLAVAWKVVKHVRSNAIVLVKEGALVGVGAGQMSRVDSVELAVKKAGERAKGSVLGSDAFFPFRDGLDAAARAGVTAVIQPGGSRRDAEVVEAADSHGVAMLFTGVRHFRH